MFGKYGDAQKAGPENTGLSSLLETVRGQGGPMLEVYRVAQQSKPLPNDQKSY